MPPFYPPADSPNIKRPPMVDCGMVDFLDRDKRSNLVLPSRFGQGNKPPRRSNIAQNMHPNKRCRRSLARPNRTTPEYHDVDHGVAVGWPRRFCVIAPIAFVGGMGGWCRGALNSSTVNPKNARPPKKYILPGSIKPKNIIVQSIINVCLMY